MRFALIFIFVCCVAFASFACEARSARVWRQMEDAAYAFHTEHRDFPHDLASLQRFALAHHLRFPLREFVSLRIRYVGPRYAELLGETKPPESNSEGRRLVITY